jgi:hypothetical protein
MRTNVSDVAVPPHVWPVLGENPLTEWVDLDLPHDIHARPLKT